MQSHSRTPLRILAAVAVVAGMTVLAACGSPGPSATGTPSSPPASVARSAAPAVLSGILVRHQWCLMCIYDIGITVLDDGLALRYASGHVEARRLSGAGIAWLRARLDQTAALDRPATFEPEALPAASDNSHEHGSYRFRVDHDGVRIDVSSGIPADYADEPGAWRFPPEALRLAALAGGLENLDAWVPEEMWASAWSTYQPDHYLVAVQLDPDPAEGDTPPAGAPDVDLVPWPFGPVERMGRPTAADGSVRCLVIDRDTAALMALAEGAFGYPRDIGEPYVTNVYAWGRQDGQVVVGTRWVLPYETPDCSLAASDF